jgi:hypothetical protein
MASFLGCCETRETGFCYVVAQALSFAPFYGFWDEDL